LINALKWKRKKVDNSFEQLTRVQKNNWWWDDICDFSFFFFIKNRPSICHKYHQLRQEYYKLHDFCWHITPCPDVQAFPQNGIYKKKNIWKFPSPPNEKKGPTCFFFLNFAFFLLQSLVTFWAQIFLGKHFSPKIFAQTVTKLWSKKKQNSKTKKVRPLFTFLFFIWGDKKKLPLCKKIFRKLHHPLDMRRIYMCYYAMCQSFWMHSYFGKM
jgi:hypothetical protein